MRFLVGFVLVVLLSVLTAWLTPWWWAVVFYAALLGFALQMKDGLSFLCGFLAAFSFWGVSMYWQNAANEGMLLDKIKGVLGINISSDLYFILMVAAIGGLLAGLGMLSAKLLRDLITGSAQPEDKRRRRRKRR